MLFLIPMKNYKMGKKILIVCPQESSSFVQLDASILRTRYKVGIISFSRLPSPKILWAFVTIGKELAKERTTCIIMWFSVPHIAPAVTVLARIFGVRIVAITGGFDVANVPSIEWGDMRLAWKRTMQRFALHHVDKILPFSEFSQRDTLLYAPKNSTYVIYPGIDVQHFTPGSQKENLVITTCNLINRFTVIQKGLSIFIKCAESLPEYSFLIVGEIDRNDSVTENIFRHKPPNLSLTERYISDEELLSLYRKARVYVQASAHEGFGIACAEAMACECIPVGTLNTSLPEVIGDTGFLVPYNDIQATINAIKSAMQQSSAGKIARERIVRNFSLQKRSSEMLSTIDTISRN
jgi:glycosyltransferase involved in cell wall biosynthesis